MSSYDDAISNSPLSPVRGTPLNDSLTTAERAALIPGARVPGDYKAKAKTQEEKVHDALSKLEVMKFLVPVEDIKDDFIGNAPIIEVLERKAETLNMQEVLRRINAGATLQESGFILRSTEYAAILKCIHENYIADHDGYLAFVRDRSVPFAERRNRAMGAALGVLLSFTY